MKIKQVSAAVRKRCT